MKGEKKGGGEEPKDLSSFPPAVRTREKGEGGEGRRRWFRPWLFSGEREGKRGGMDDRIYATKEKS